MNTLTGLEDSLIDDPLGHTRRRLLDALAETANELARQQRGLRSIEAVSQLERQRRSCFAAMEVIDRVWLCRYGNRSTKFR